MSPGITPGMSPGIRACVDRTPVDHEPSLLESLEPRLLMSSGGFKKAWQKHKPDKAETCCARAVKESEPNDSPDAANGFAFHSSGSARLMGRFQSSTDQDYFTFTADAAGLVDMKVHGLCRGSAVIDVYAADGTSLLQMTSDDKAGQFIVEAGATYYIRLANSSESAWRWRGMYMVKLEASELPEDPPAEEPEPSPEVPPTTNVIAESEANNNEFQPDVFTLDDTGRAILTGVVSGSTDNDFFRFTPAPAPGSSGTLRIEVITTSAVAPQLLFKPLGSSPIAQTDPVTGVNTIEVSVTAGTSYYLHLRNLVGGDANYEVRVTLV